MLVLLSGRSFAQPDPTELVFVGSGHKNIYAFRLNLTSGELRAIGKAAGVASPSFLATTPNQKYLYAITEGTTKGNSFVSAFRIDSESGKLALLNREPSGGAGPCYLAADAKGKNVLVANYISGSVSVFPIDGHGALGPMSAFVQDHGSSVDHYRQEGPHAHSVLTDPDGRFAFACDLGLDKVMIFKFDPAKGSLEANDPPSASIKPGSGPRHIAFHPNRRFAYVISEMACTLTAFAYDPDRGVLTETGDYPLLSKDFKGQSWAAEVAIHPSGRFVYASNRGDDSISVFGCDPATGRLTFIERVSTEGKTPRNFDIDPSGAFLLAANQDSGTIIVFRIDPKSGHLEPIGGKITADKPMCVKCMMTK